MAKTVIVEHDGVEHETDNAKLMKFAEGKEWIPISQIEDEDETWVEIPEWLAAEKGLI